LVIERAWKRRRPAQSRQSITQDGIAQRIPPSRERRDEIPAYGPYRLKTPYRDGTNPVIFEPLDFIARLAALVPDPRVNLTRFHGVFAPNSQHRAAVKPAKRGKGAQPRPSDEGQERTPDRDAPRSGRGAGFGAQRLKRVFGIDIQICPTCGGALRVIACIEDPAVINKIPSLGP
jgi:hypothetical protein